MREPDLFWRHFAHVCETHDDMLQLIISHLPPGASGCLRQVNVSMRAAVNRTVSTVACSLRGARFSSELATTFPRADRLKVDLHSSGDITHTDVRFFLEYIAATSPALVNRSCALALNLGNAAPSEEIHVAVASFLARYRSVPLHSSAVTHLWWAHLHCRTTLKPCIHENTPVDV
jgi:hypothetical protein